MSSNLVGIDQIGVYVPKYYIEMDKLAEARGVDPNKFLIGIGQDQMAVPPQWEDIVSMGANAAKQFITQEDLEAIDQVIFATESSFDFSKSAATYIHELLGVQSYAKSFEVKQACYSGTAAILSAYDYVRLRPNRKVLVITADIARYGLQTSGEATQGAGAVAILISANPRILALDSETVSYTDNQYDFWRPSYSEYALVEGKFSTELYLDSFLNVIKKYEQKLSSRLIDLKAIAFHLPFTKMAKKALNHYNQADTYIEKKIKEEQVDIWRSYLEDASKLNRSVGNIYTGSLYLSLYSLLAFSNELTADDRIGLFSYGSGAVSELYTGTLQPNFQDFLHADQIRDMFTQREEITIPEYEAYFKATFESPEDQFLVENKAEENNFYLHEINQHRRYYKIKK